MLVMQYGAKARDGDAAVRVDRVCAAGCVVQDAGGGRAIFMEMDL